MGVTKKDIAEDKYGCTKGYDDLLRSLATTNEGKKKKDKKKNGKKEKKKEVKKAETVSRSHRKKCVQNKDVSKYTDAQLKEIFGV